MEYMLLSPPDDILEFSNILNLYGKAGWEVAACYLSTLILKRPSEPEVLRAPRGRPPKHKHKPSPDHGS
jgi:hypothetical protein